MKRRLFSMLVLLLMAVTGAWAAAKTIDLSNVTEATTANNGDVLTGTLAKNVQISIEHGATVTLNNVSINADGAWTSGYYAGITCLGDATITLTGNNFVKGFDEGFPGIHVAAAKTLTIQGNGSLTASSNGSLTPGSNGAGAGIGGGRSLACGGITIEGGTIIATGGVNSAGIGGGDVTSCGDISINGGIITATGGESGAGIGAGYYGSCGNISITGGTVNATGGSNATAIGRGYLSTCGSITLALADNVNNGSTLTSFNDITADVTLKRTLQTGGWNTFCAPFSTATPSGWTLKKLTGSSFDSSTGQLTLDFGDAVSIEAGRAYLVKVTANVVNPTFEGVTIANVTTTTETTYADFVPVMNPTPLTANDKTVLFVSGGNKLTYPSKTSNINGFRAYFQLKGDAAASANAFAMSFDNGSTGITEIDDSQAHDVRFDTDGIYTLDGRRIEGQPTAKGIYIQNGRKVIIK
jgi:hypothetical protein